jgi:hypothetical protein
MTQSADPKGPNAPKGTNGKLVVIVLLILGVILGFTLSRMMPHTNPRAADPGSPYYSPPTNEELKAEREGK